MKRLFRPGLRTKLLLISGFLFTIPWIGYEYVWEMEKYLRAGQEKTLQGTVRAVATALHERPKLFDLQASYRSLERGRDLYAYPIVDPIRLDGDLRDWRLKQHALDYGANNILLQSDAYHPGTLTFRHMVGKYREHLYAYFEVSDDSITYRPQNSLRVDRNDHLQIAFTTPAGDFRRYLISPYQAGWLTPYEIATDDNSSTTPLKPEPRIQGALAETPQGYNVELRIPLKMLSSKLSFAITDFDQQSKEPAVTISTSDIWNEDKLGTVLVPSPEIEQIIKGLGHSASRIWVVDQHQRVLAKAGDIKTTDGAWNTGNDDVTEDGAWRRFEQTFLHPLYYQFLTKPPKDFIDELYDAGNLEGLHIEEALAGRAGSSWRLTADNKAVILAAAYPIYINQQVMGAVIAEETTNGIRTLRNRALEKLFTMMLGVMLISTVGIFLFASRISARIRTLRDQAELAIDTRGRIQAPIEASTAHDEIGDLSRSYAGMLHRLTQYHHYLENMSSRLSHELRTPVAVVKSSLETLDMEQEGIGDSVYLQRAREGLDRLSSILTNMSEASRLEESLQQTENQDFNLVALLEGCIQGYRLAYPEREIHLVCAQTKVQLHGAPDLLAQLLDKLINNAMEFAPEGTPISVTLEVRNQTAHIEVKNQGPELPDNMQGRLFDSMVSVRTNPGANQQPHLGLGLYIARLITEFHKGRIEIANRDDTKGVVVRVLIPLS